MLSTRPIKHALALFVPMLGLSGCFEDVGALPGGVTPGTTSLNDSASPGDNPDSDGQSDLCFSFNCERDADCGGCDAGRSLCDLSEKRCVACDPDTGMGCEGGETCTEFGACVPEGLSCDVDDADGRRRIYMKPLGLFLLAAQRVLQSIRFVPQADA